MIPTHPLILGLQPVQHRKENKIKTDKYRLGSQDVHQVIKKVLGYISLALSMTTFIQENRH